jgi:basic amino acid/polyamine antiporter, APA family
VKNPRHTVPFGLLAGLVVCAAVYTLVQFVTVATIGVSTTPRPLAETASVLVGQSGGMLLTIGVMISTYGWLSGGLLEVPRLACSLAAQGDAPVLLGKLHPRFKTPSIAIVLFAAFIWLLAATGAYLWIAALGSGALIVIYSAGCAALIKLRRKQPHADALRLPFGRAFALAGILICLAVLTRLHAREALLMGITAMIATANWWWAKQRERRVSQAVIAAGASN